MTKRDIVLHYKLQSYFSHSQEEVPCKNTGNFPLKTVKLQGKAEMFWYQWHYTVTFRLPKANLAVTSYY